MSKLNVVLYPNPILKKKCDPITVFDDKLRSLVDDMFDTMKAFEGIGLAAPQVGIASQLLIVGYEGREFALVNPLITIQSGRSVSDEGCLSLPNLLVTVERYSKIEVQAQDVYGNPITLSESGFIATIIQHEMDHLNGVLIIDHGTPMLQE